jgi:hypothetical protein
MFCVGAIKAEYLYTTEVLNTNVLASQRFEQYIFIENGSSNEKKRYRGFGAQLHRGLPETFYQNHPQCKHLLMVFHHCQLDVNTEVWIKKIKIYAALIPFI